MKKLLPLFLILVVVGTAMNLPEKDMWALMGKTRFVEKLNREYGMYFLYPKFPDELKAMEGKEVSITGFFIPLEMNTSNIAVISKYPNAECFFCGGAGPESVVVGYLKKRPGKRIKTDEIVTIKGKLKLNDSDLEELNFIIQDAELSY
ncbi:MAG: hypothetical protein EA341_00255 [Mongoliibacter sp.]|jgi:hypothetical protein|uniref:hypothetical protein n=1 Tax=Mongoliibacter sp. TaxID=2022438 RepID=UPI0012F40029|nr:hypothetical protein [Mongoliibacter sp.]TVP54360.1 MAG: hypothetical protein EA341_00255 [Mongoliibacter sp.]